MRRYFYDLRSSTLNLVLYWWGKKTTVLCFGKYNARNKYNCMASKRTSLVTLLIDLDKSHNKGKCLLLCLKVSGGSSGPRSSSSTALTNKAKIPINPVPLPTVKQQPEKSFKTKKKAEIRWQVQSDAIWKGWLINPKIQGYLWNWSQTNCNYIDQVQGSECVLL